MVVHEAGHTIGSPVAGREYVDGARVCSIPKDEFLAPVAKDVSLQTWCTLRPVTAVTITKTVNVVVVAI